MHPYQHASAPRAAMVKRAVATEKAHSFGQAGLASPASWREAMQRFAEALIAPTLICGVLAAFLAITYGAARALALLWPNQIAHGTFLGLWLITTVIGIVLVRQIPRFIS